MGFLPLPAATNWLRCLFLGLSVLVVPAPGSLQVPTPPGLRVLEALEGSEVVLPAWYTVMEEGGGYHSWELLSAIWFQQYQGKEPEQVLAYIKGATVNDEDKASLVYPMPSQNVSLRLRGLQEENSGLYFCSVNVQDRQSHRKDHAKSKTLELNVLVPPAPPSCRVVGVPQVKTNVSLSCKSPRSKPAALYEWVRQPPSPQAFFPPMSDTYKGYLNLSNLTPSMSGVYTCKVQNRVGSSACNVTLEVSTGSGPTVVAGAIMGTLLGLVLLAGLVLLFWRRRGQTKGMEEQANDIKEDAAAPRTLPWPKGSDTISKNGTLSSVTSARALRSPAGPARPGTMTPTPSLSSQALSSPRLPGTNRTPPQPATPGQSGMSSMLSRMGAVPVMVPSQSQAGSLV